MNLEHQPKAPVSVVILTKNEEKNIGDCLKSVAWAKEIILLDDESTDRTREIAAQFEARIIPRKMENEGRHRNFGYDQAHENWILSLDADERVTPELAEEIKTTLLAPTAYTAFSIPRRNFIGSTWIQHGGWYPSGQLRLFQKGKFKYREDEVHCFPLLEGTSGLLKNDMIHYSYKSFEDFLHKLNKQTTLEAKKWVRTQRNISFLHAHWRAVDRFFRSFVLKKGYKDGLYLGFAVAVFAALYQVISYAKYWEMKRTS
ncbi:MAG: glycosyltransferase family 2 protein [Deltaproteobacteria bacterium]|nr:glycosyltransferase family 2 protein [Deltaproteobacteria bacterium]